MKTKTCFSVLIVARSAKYPHTIGYTQCVHPYNRRPVSKTQAGTEDPSPSPQKPGGRHSHTRSFASTSVSGTQEALSCQMNDFFLYRLWPSRPAAPRDLDTLCSPHQERPPAQGPAAWTATHRSPASKSLLPWETTHGFSRNYLDLDWASSQRREIWGPPSFWNPLRG